MKENGHLLLFPPEMLLMVDYLTVEGIYKCGLNHSRRVFVIMFRTYQIPNEE
jgi:hypothetical protein